MKNLRNKKQVDRKKMIAEANARFDAEHGGIPPKTHYAKHIPGRKDISQKR